MKRPLIVALSGVVMVASLSVANPASAKAEPIDELTPTQTAAAIDRADHDVAIADVRPSGGGDLIATANGSTVEIPADPSDGISLTAGGQNIVIDLPGADESQNATVVGDTVVYENAAPSTDVAVQATTGGGVRQLMTIAGPEAPNSFAFPVDVPDGATLALTEDGGARIVRGTEEIAVIAPAWARDANGASVPSHYTVDGNKLTQHVQFNTGTAFPVTADPLWIAGIVFYIVGTRCGVGAAGAMLIYRLFTERRSMSGYFGNAVIGCLTGGLGIRRY